MLRNMSREEHFAGGQTSPSTSTGLGEVASLRHDNQDSSWISSISRPALSFLQKYLPGRSRTPARSESLSGWVSGDFKQNLVDGERAFFGQLDDIMPATQPTARHHLAYLHCQREGTVALGASGSTGTLSWLTADSLRELGIEDAAEMDLTIRQQTPAGYLATARSFLNHVLLNSASAQEIRTTEQVQVQVLGGDSCPSDAVTARAKSSSGNWWAGFWGTEEHRAQGWLSNLSWSKEETGVSAQHSCGHCPQLESGTKATVAKPTELFVQCSDGESMDSESPGPSCHKEEATDKYNLLTAQPESLPSSEELPFDHRSCITIDSHHVSVGAVTACSEVAVLTPDQDNGYSSLEEEHSACRLFMLKPPREDLQGTTEIKGDTVTPGCSGEREPEREASEKGEEGETAAGGMEGEGEEEEEEEEMDDSDLTDSEEEEETATVESQSAAAPPLSPPQCQNKAIAYIMGSPCSDDNQSEDELSEDDEDDDGFDSEGSSEFSNSDEDDDEEEEEESDSDQADAETERLWNSLCQSRDPYNPQNFTASIHTAPRTVPPSLAVTTSSHRHASPPSPALLSSSPSPLLEEDDFGDESASEADEAESLRLWNSFSASLDPYSPLNFQAPLRTQEPSGSAAATGAGRRSKKARTPPHSPHHGSSPPQYRNEEAEERLDSGFSETLPFPVTSTTSCVTVKKVRFCEDVEEFYASGDEEEDRRGPWEELARDRCRFLRRVQEVEETIAYVLAPKFRMVVFQKLHHHS